MNDKLKYPTKKFKSLKRALNKVLKAQENIEKYYGTGIDYKKRKANTDGRVR